MVEQARPLCEAVCPECGRVCYRDLTDHKVHICEKFHRWELNPRRPRLPYKDD